MNIKNTSLNEHLTLKPLPPKILLCTKCKIDPLLTLLFYLPIIGGKVIELGPA
jgi:hypothetical protein